jgi:hypothetical protein
MSKPISDAVRTVARGAFEAWLEKAEVGQGFWTEVGDGGVDIQADTNDPGTKQRLAWEVETHAKALGIHGTVEKSEGVPL